MEPKKTILLSVNPQEPEPEKIHQAAEVLRYGGLVAFPTETVYGLGADALSAEAVHRIFEAKGRPPRNPLIVHVADCAAARKLAAQWPDKAEILARKFWPGSLTLVVPKVENIPDVVTGGGPTVALRVPAHPVALALLRESELPVAAPSANLSSRLSPTSADHVFKDLSGRVDLILDGGPCPGGLESTVLDVSTSPPRLLRPGLVTLAQIEEVIGPIVLAKGVPAGEADEITLPSPGMLHRHYAPRARLQCVESNGRQRVLDLTRYGMRLGWLTFTDREKRDIEGVITIALPRDPVEYAAQLYAALHKLDDAGVDWIVVDLPPQTSEWLAVHDRLRRASAS